MTWEYDDYWCGVLDDLDAASVVAVYALVGPRRNLDEWLGHCEADALEVLGLTECPPEWGAYHTRALDELLAAIEVAS